MKPPRHHPLTPPESGGEKVLPPLTPPKIGGERGEQKDPLLDKKGMGVVDQGERHRCLIVMVIESITALS